MLRAHTVAASHATLMCRALKVSRSGFYAAERRRPSARARRRESLRKVIAAVYETSRGTYGSPRIYQELRNDERPCGRNLIARLMRESGLRAKPRRRWRPQTTDSQHQYGVAQNVLRRRFGVKETSGINRAWCGDITYIRTTEGWLYLAVLLDLGSRMVVGWAMRESLELSLSVDALRMALGLCNLRNLWILLLWLRVELAPLITLGVFPQPLVQFFFGRFVTEIFCQPLSNEFPFLLSCPG